MKNKKKRNMLFLMVAAAALVVVSLLPAHAAPIVIQGFDTIVHSAAPGNPFFAAAGIYPGEARYDLGLDPPLPVGPGPGNSEWISALDDPELKLTVKVGDLVMHELDDANWMVFPQLLLNSTEGMLQIDFVVEFNYPPFISNPPPNGLGQFQFSATEADTDGFFLGPNEFIIKDYGPDGQGDPIVIVDGEFFLPDPDFNPNDPANQVPIPAAVWLFGSGLICLVGIRRLKK